MIEEKKCFLERLIQWLQDLETRKHRGCHLCAHVSEPQDVYPVHDDLSMVVLSPCYGCDRTHDCFQLDHEKLAEEVESGLMTKGEARHVWKKEEKRQIQENGYTI